MEISPLQHNDGVHAGSALENLAHRLVAVHQGKAPETAGGRRAGYVPDLPLFTEAEFGLDAPSGAGAPGFLDRLRRLFHN